MADPAALARLHAAAFPEGRPWAEAEFADLLRASGALVVARPEGFALGRVVAGEAELIMLVVDPAQRRRGLGRGLLAAFEARAHEADATTFFLEVAEDNIGARALYRAHGWQEIGRRKSYYARHDLPAVDAICMEKRLT